LGLVHLFPVLFFEVQFMFRFPLPSAFSPAALVFFLGFGVFFLLGKYRFSKHRRWSVFLCLFPDETSGDSGITSAVRTGGFFSPQYLPQKPLT